MPSKGTPAKAPAKKRSPAKPKAPSWADAQGKLRAVIRPIARTAHDAGRKVLPVRKPFAPYLAVHVFFDQRLITSEDLALWKVTEDMVIASAMARLAPPDAALRPLGDDDPPWWQLGANDDDASAALLVPGFLAGLADRIGGRPVVAIPEAGTLLITSDRDVDTLLALATHARDAHDESETGLSPCLYTVDAKGAVIALVSPGPGPLATAVKLGETMLALREYTLQKQDLEGLLADAAEDIAVASYTALRQPGGRPVSWALWSEGVPTLLPRTDVVHFAAADSGDDDDDDDVDDDDGFDVPWEAIAIAAPEALIEVPGMSLPRWRTRRWPKPIELARLRAAACDLEELGRATVTAEADAAIAGFWSWWRRGQARVERAIAGSDQAAVTRELAALITAIDDELQWELTPGKHARYGLTLSANGDPDRRALTEAWCAKAPEHEAWEFHASRQQRIDTTLVVNGHRMPLADASFVWAPDVDAGLLDIAIFHPEFTSMSNDDRDSAAVLLLDAALGEDGVEQAIGGIEVAHKKPKAARPLAEFLAAVAAL